ncbi:aromatic-ring-hydroxylating dioxygenase subunit beta [Streptomyces luomodiensis]|uniref:Aromatic-ring-hydroxylating dioxygenase subunit beta n=1 Tax=Streptomyces luomodiensis TaxID=3026192 RepID=A0ABY9UP90_9ACTN|nr:aromatic-ring-hydroxylating dioxygenase subunit beta [Streptomyces sp. SCA4-21]WNE94356.1 aromatic-ring-hydroxylating dioxygenase subunit beta [Streptomyces sp. SCA4-21]
MAADTALLADPRIASAIELVWHEADLLDRKEYQEWDRLWAPGGRYVIPIDPQTKDFAATLNMVYDDDRMRRMRIERLTSGYSISAVAAARTVRTLSRFVVRHRDDAVVELGSAQVLVGHRREETFVLGADVTHRIRLDGAGPLIEEKVIRLINSDGAVNASGFLL